MSNERVNTDSSIHITENNKPEWALHILENTGETCVLKLEVGASGIAIFVRPVEGAYPALNDLVNCVQEFLEAQKPKKLWGLEALAAKEPVSHA